MSARLLETKFHVPAWRAAGVRRPRLLELLRRGLDEHHALTLLAAPAGYGKTTLVAEWLSTFSPRPVTDARAAAAWLSLDAADNEPRRFLRYFVTAFRKADAAIGARIDQLLELPTPPDVRALLDELLNDLAAAAAPIILVLDDYHFISHPEIHTALGYVVDHLPATTHLVLTTRADPPLPLARLRAQRQLTEIRARDLRFTTDEARLFFGQTRLALAEDALRALDERTEGWAAGLQLAALALHHQPDPSTFIETFRGSHRYVLDYLASEVLHRQSSELRVFLTRTSLLDRFNADLCLALTGREDAQTLISELEQSNLFVVALDDERRWFRYHHLFADYLQSLLPKAEQVDLFKKAAAWHEANHLTTDAVRYALAGGDGDYAAQVVENALEKNATWSDGNLAQLTTWLDALPPAAIDARPRLGVHAARVCYVQGHFAESEERLARVEVALRIDPAPPDQDELLALVDLNRGALAAVRGDFDTVLSLVPAAQARVRRDDHLAHCRAAFCLGQAHDSAGQFTRATEQYLRASTEARAAGVLFMEIQGLCGAAQLEAKSGRLNRAAGLCRDAVRRAANAALPSLGLAWSILGTIALERNDLTAAERDLQQGIALSRQGGLRGDLLVGLMALGRLQACRGDADGMQTTIDEAMAIIQSVGVPHALRLARAHLARHLLVLGRHDAAARWADDCQATRTEPLSEFEELTLARVRLASGQADAAADLLRPLLERAEAAGLQAIVLEDRILLSLCHHACSETPVALEWLSKALEDAAPEGYRRIFLDAGPPLLSLLPRVRQVAPELVDSLLSAAASEKGRDSGPLSRLPDSLSEQELRVLKLIVAGKTNAEIAADLVISVGTAKWHVHNVLQKLGVGNRSQAIARVRGGNHP